jgi:ABC-type amino acid transport substrate-binding protein
MFVRCCVTIRRAFYFHWSFADEASHIGSGSGCPAVSLLASPAQSATLDQVKARGTLRCGVVPDPPGLSVLDSRGKWQGFNADICRAIAAAVPQDVKRLRTLTPIGVEG